MDTKKRIVGTVLGMGLVAVAPASAGADVHPVEASSSSTVVANALPRAGVIQTVGDYVHVSRYNGIYYASAHGCWKKYSGPGTTARVTVWLQKRVGNGWVTRSKQAKTIKQGCGSVARTNAKANCGGIVAKTTWRTMVDVDIIGVADSPEVLITKSQTLWCNQ
ncbi:hypothetical protein [Luteipulveratus halotolerans]|uniref:hypothetical protein n=1 Tax=Luteipulveratus halotolerans TaxID=1631356 RepID=UPI0012F7F8A3|nr:hypothetical protein [Luteipulveratus halotolerans]